MSKHIIFDMDVTLFQTNKILELSLKDAFDQLRSVHKWSSETPIEKYQEIMGVPLPMVWETLMPTHSIEEREQTDAYFLDKLIENIGEGKGALYPNVKQTFTHLVENGFSIYIASNGLSAYLKAIVDYYELDEWITETWSIQQIDSLHKSDLVGTIKEKYKITNGVVVGDRLSDIHAAKDNQLVSIGCNFDFAQEDELAHADFVIDNLQELPFLLSTLRL